MSDQYLDDTVRKWIVYTANREHWRVSWYNVEDLIQDGYVCYSRCKIRYQPLLDHGVTPGYDPSKHPHPRDGGPRARQRWFMALFQRAYFNHIQTLAKRFPTGKEVELQTDTWGELVEGPKQEDASLRTALLNVPAELVDLVDRIIQDGLDGSDFLRKRKYTNRYGRFCSMATTPLLNIAQEYWTRMMGNPDQVEELVDYLSGDQSPPKSKRFERLAAMSRRYRHERFVQLAAASRNYQEKQRESV